MFNFFRLQLFLIIAILPLSVFAQNPVSWSLESDAKGKDSETISAFKAKLKASIEGDWHLYAVGQPEGGPFPTKITIANDSVFSINGKISSPEPITKFDPNFQIDTKFFVK